MRDRMYEPHTVGIGERRPQREQLIDRQTKTINVGPGIGMAAKSLRRHVTDRAHHFAGPGQIAAFFLGQSEISHPENAASVKIVAADWVDYLHLAKYNGRWVIVNVLWEMKPPPGR